MGAASLEGRSTRMVGRSGIALGRAHIGATAWCWWAPGEKYNACSSSAVGVGMKNREPGWRPALNRCGPTLRDSSLRVETYLVVSLVHTSLHSSSFSPAATPQLLESADGYRSCVMRGRDEAAGGAGVPSAADGMIERGATSCHC